MFLTYIIIQSYNAKTYVHFQICAQIFFKKCNSFRLKSNHMNYQKFMDSKSHKGQEGVCELEGVTEG